MTGEKNKFKTHEQLWKLEDGDLSTPQHDELVLQLLNQKNLDLMLDFLNIGSYATLFTYQTTEQVKKSLIETAKNKLGYRWDLKTEELERLSIIFEPFAKEYIKKNAMYIDEDLKWIFHKTEISKIKSEVPITTGNGFIIGYIDVQAVIKTCNVTSTSTLSSSYEVDLIKTIHDLPLMERIRTRSDPTRDEKVSYKGIIEGIIQTFLYIPDLVKYKDENAWKNPEKDYKKINIEVKPKIKSFGETLRQINTYREFDRDAVYIIYSPDARFKEAFESQGIKFVTPQDLGLK